MRHPLSASERRGIIVIALVALLVTGAGIIVPRCSRGASRIEAAEMQILVDADSVGAEGRDSVGKRRGAGKKSRKRSAGKAGKERSGKDHTYRSPLDENPL